MATDVQTSGPLPPEDFTQSLWQTHFFNDVGIIGDTDGSAFGITLPPSGSTAEIGSATIDSIAKVGGYPLKIAAGTTQSIDIPASVGGGATGRTDLIVARCDIPNFTTAPGPVRLHRIPGTEGSSAVPVHDPATDLRLWRVRRIEGESLNQTIAVPERTWLGRTILVEPGATLPTGAPLGTRAVRAGVIYRRDLVGGAPTWVLETSPIQTLTGLSATAAPSDPNIGATVAGWQRQSSCRLVRDGKQRWLHLVSRKGGSDITSGSNSGHVQDQHLATLHTQDRPPAEVAASVTVRSIGGGSYWGGGFIKPSGTIYVNSWAPNIDIGPSSGDEAVVMDAVWWVS